MSLAAAIPEGVREVCDRFAAAGFRAWLVGGCVRNLVMGEQVVDWDLATDATPAEVRRLFRRTIPTGIAHGTVTVLHRGQTYEVTTLRGEGPYSDGRRPDAVHFVTDIEADLARRDFTVNAIAYDPRADALVDPFGGAHDVAAKILRAVGDPRERFREDGLRVLRAARFVATLELDPDPTTEAAIPEALETFRKVSAERVHDECAKILTRARQPSRAFRLMRRTGLLAEVAPAVAALDEPAFERAMRRVDAAVARLPDRIAALLFEAVGDHERWMRERRFSNDETRRAMHLLAHARIREPQTWSDADVRRFLHRAGRSHADDVLRLAAADRTACGEPVEPIERLRERARAEIEAGVPLAVSDLAVGGEDVLRALGSRPGRHVGAVLARLLERALEDPTLNERDELLALVPDVARELGVP